MLILPTVWIPLIGFGIAAGAPSNPAGRAAAAGEDSSWVARVSQDIRDGEYAFHPAADEPGVWSAPNRSQELRSRVSRDGVEIFPRATAQDGRGAPWKLSLATRSFGRAGSADELDAASITVQADRAEIDHGVLREWFVNEHEGLEQGWTILAPPGLARPGGTEPVWIGLEFGGDLYLHPDDSARSGTLVDAGGTVRMRYRDLRAFDARGRELAAELRSSPSGAGIAIDDEGAVYPLRVDPVLTGPAWTAESDQASAGFGISVSTAGDVDGDGFSDVIVGAYLFDDGESQEGRAFVYLGSPSGLSTSAAWTAEGDQIGANFGTSVAMAGDVNGDGYGDVIVGAPEFDDGQVSEGRAYVYLGSASGLAATPAWTAESDQAFATFGNSVSTAGDVNGDGYGDILVGATQYSNGQVSEGAAFLYLGSASGLSTSPSWTAESDQANALFGNSVAAAGDVNGDGYADVVVGALAFDNPQVDEGRAYAYLGSASGLSPAPAWTAEGNQAGGRFGNSVGAAGDVNGDGYGDVIVAGRTIDNGETDEGRAFVYLGSAAGLALGPAWVAENDQASSLFGYSVGTAGDVNGDGYSDVIVGARAFDGGQADEGRAYAYLGSAGGLSTIPAWTAESDQAAALFGVSVSTAGDVNGDGYSDVIVGASDYNGGEAGEGRAYVFTGSPAGLSTVSSWSAQGNLANASFGISVSSAGDVNGDGYSDVIVGASLYDNGQLDEGRAYTYLGSASGLATSAAWTAEGNQASAIFGSSVASAGDVNGDGYGDVIVGAQSFDNGQTNEGRAYVYLGSGSGLSTSAAWTAESDQANAFFAYSVAGAGDVNGDGYGDVIVGAQAFDNGQTNEGRAYVYTGSSVGLSTVPAWTAEGDQTSAFFGVPVASAGDVNGDGFGDVIIGAFNFDNGELNEGRAFVYLGSGSGLGATPAWTAEGNQANALFGSSAATAGDVNGDGYSDVVVGAWAFDDDQTNEGRAYVYLGSPVGLAASPAWTVDGNQTDAAFGICVASAGDVNGDGYSDVIVGANSFDNGEANEGRAYVYLGSASGLATSPSWTAEANQPDAAFGISVASAGDVDGDGYGDVIVGANNFDDGQTNEGAAFVYLGNAGVGSWTSAVQQRQWTDTAPISLLGKSSSTSQFRIRIQSSRRLSGFTWAGSPTPKARLEWEVVPLSHAFDLSLLQSGTEQTLTGLPVVFDELAEFQPFPGSRTGRITTGAYRWRARLRTGNPVFPATPWVSIAGNNETEAKLQTRRFTARDPR